MVRCYTNARQQDSHLPNAPQLKDLLNTVFVDKGKALDNLLLFIDDTNSIGNIVDFTHEIARKLIFPHDSLLEFMNTFCEINLAVISIGKKPASLVPLYNFFTKAPAILFGAFMQLYRQGAIDTWDSVPYDEQIETVQGYPFIHILRKLIEDIRCQEEGTIFYLFPSITDYAICDLVAGELDDASLNIDQYRQEDLCPHACLLRESPSGERYVIGPHTLSHTHNLKHASNFDVFKPVFLEFTDGQRVEASARRQCPFVPYAAPKNS